MRRTHETCTIDDCKKPHEARGMCALHYRRWSKKGDPRAAPVLNDTGICVVRECGKRSRSPRSAYCEMHYCRLYHSGTLEGAQMNAARGVHEKSNGYLQEMNKDHPAARRRVFYDANGPGPYRCHWCSKWVTWKKLKVDHKDTNRKNNEPGNLVASCQVCNLNRNDRRKMNRYNSPTITFEGQTRTIAAWAQRVGIKVEHFYRRLERWPLEKALTTPARKHALRKPKQLGMMDELFDASAAIAKQAAERLDRSRQMEQRA
jgi:hypothetical protein